MSAPKTTRARQLRQNGTDAEKLFWARIRNRQVANLKFRRQYPVPPYIVDFFCIENKLVIELDGEQHSPAQDGPRERFLQAQGFRVLRFWNNDVLTNIDGVLQTIYDIAHPAP